MTVVGARPQFVKLAPLSRALRRHVREIVVHTGQHYDREMSDAFFSELSLPSPDRHLGVGSGPHGAMTGRMLEALEAVLVEEAPAMVVVLGDTNSTLAGALAAAKLGIPVAHVEAGLRSFDLRMPEEVNRRLVDHVSDLLFCPTPSAVRNLAREGIRHGVHRVGDVMADAVHVWRRRAQRRPRAIEGIAPGAYYLATLHRQENADDPERLAHVLEALSSLRHPTVLPLHPRTARRMEAVGLKAGGLVRLVPPQPYLEMLRLQAEARAVLTDSGGMQKEAYLLGTPCITLRETTEWVETLRGGANRLTGADPRRIVRAVAAVERKRPRWDPRRTYGDGHAAERIAKIIAVAVRSRP
ncbi:MAG TPA: UDP-N-acetylglucosamine 2-epimerase (non-hydrolyzing) [Vicinamibacteria bacterium]